MTVQVTPNTFRVIV